MGKTSQELGCGQLLGALTRGFLNRIDTAACAVAHDRVQVHAQPFLVVRETGSCPLECFYRTPQLEWLELPIVTITTVNEDALLCPQIRVIAYRNVLIIQLNVRVKHPWIRK